MLAYLEMMRPANGIMSVLAVFVGALLVLHVSVLSSIETLVAAISAFLIMGAGNVINDWADVEADNINRPKRPIPSGRVKSHHALYFSMSLFAIGIAMGAFINTVTFVIAILNSLLLIAYSTWFQHKILLGNFVVSYLVGSCFVYGGAAAGDVLVPGLLLLLAFAANMAREIVKDLEDVEGDRKAFLKRLASKIPLVGERFASESVSLKHQNTLLFLAFLFLTIAIIISPLPFYVGVLGQSYLWAVAIADILYGFAMVQIVISSKKPSAKAFHQTSKTVKLGMLFGLVAFLVGALV